MTPSPAPPDAPYSGVTVSQDGTDPDRGIRCATCGHALTDGDRSILVVDGLWTSGGTIDPINEMGYFHYECFVPSPDGPLVPAAENMEP